MDLRPPESCKFSTKRRIDRRAKFPNSPFGVEPAATLSVTLSVVTLLLTVMFGARGALAQGASAQNSALTTPASSSMVVDRINYYRRLMNLTELSEDQAMSDRDRSEAHSSLNNLSAAGPVSALSDSSAAMPAIEVLSRNMYEQNGSGAPTTELSITPAATPLDGGGMVDRLMAMPFTALRVIDPQLTEIGFGAECSPNACIAEISVKRGLTKDARLEIYEGSESDRFWNARLGPIPPTRGRLKSPVYFPPDGVITPVRAYLGGDWPRPLGACGYSAPSGPPLILQLGTGASPSSDPEISEHSLTRDGQSIEHCLIQPSSFRNSNADEQAAGQRGLSAFGAAVIIPRAPLAPSGNFTVSITADSTKYSWSFKTGAPQ